MSRSRLHVRSVVMLVSALWAGPAFGQSPATTSQTQQIPENVEPRLRILESLAGFYHSEVTIYEGGGINNGWMDYRDRHLGRDTRSSQGDGRQPEDSPLAYVEPSGATSSRVDLGQHGANVTDVVQRAR